MAEEIPLDGSKFIKTESGWVDKKTQLPVDADKQNLLNIISKKLQQEQPKAVEQVITNTKKMDKDLTSLANTIDRLNKNLEKIISSKVISGAIRAVSAPTPTTTDTRVSPTPIQVPSLIQAAGQNIKEGFFGSKSKYGRVESKGALREFAEQVFPISRLLFSAKDRRRDITAKNLEQKESQSQMVQVQPQSQQQINQEKPEAIPTKTIRTPFSPGIYTSDKTTQQNKSNMLSIVVNDATETFLKKLTNSLINALIKVQEEQESKAKEQKELAAQKLESEGKATKVTNQTKSLFGKTSDDVMQGGGLGAAVGAFDLLKLLKLDKVFGFIKNIGKSITEAFSKVVKFITELGENIFKGIKAGISKIKSFFTKIIDDVKVFIEDIGKTVSKIFSGIKTAIKKLIDLLPEPIKKLLNIKEEKAAASGVEAATQVAGKKVVSKAAQTGEKGILKGLGEFAPKALKFGAEGLGLAGGALFDALLFASDPSEANKGEEEALAKARQSMHKNKGVSQQTNRVNYLSKQNQLNKESKTTKFNNVNNNVNQPIINNNNSYLNQPTIGPKGSLDLKTFA